MKSISTLSSHFADKHVTMSKDHTSSMRHLYKKSVRILLIVVITLVVSHLWRRPGRPTLKELDWWEHATIYQVYVRSFMDSDGDGIGDLRGIASKLDYLVELGVDVLWLSVILPTSMMDSGYDVTDFYDVHYVYGSVDDVQTLTQMAHALGLKVIMDLVPNHVSTDSKYFTRSQLKQRGYEDFFVWTGSKSGHKKDKLPSNWISYHGGTTWEWSPKRKEYYLHNYGKTQAEFNFRNPTVRQEILNVFNFWLNIGVDGFQLVGLKNLYEANPEKYDGEYPDEPVHDCRFENRSSGIFADPMHREHLKETLDLVYEWRRYFDNWKEEHGGNAILMTSHVSSHVSKTLQYYGYEGGHNGVHFPLNYVFIDSFQEELSARSLVMTIMKWLIYMPKGFTANWILGNQDVSRVATRFGDHMVDGLNSLLLLLPGVAISYQGEEIGMRDGNVRKDSMIDERGAPMMVSRDPERTPFHWDKSISAGFSKNMETWLPVSYDYQSINVKSQRDAEWSHLKIYKALTRLRKQPTFSHGDYHVEALTDNILVLVRYLVTFPTYVLVFNLGPTRDVADLTQVKWVTAPAEVLVPSLLAAHRIGEIISIDQVILASGDSLVLRTASS